MTAKQRQMPTQLQGVSDLIGKTVSGIATYEGYDDDRDADVIAFTDGSYAFGSFAVYGRLDARYEQLAKAGVITEEECAALVRDEQQRKDFAKEIEEYATYERLRIKYEGRQKP